MATASTGNHKRKRNNTNNDTTNTNDNTNTNTNTDTNTNTNTDTDDVDLSSLDRAGLEAHARSLRRLLTTEQQRRTTTTTIIERRRTTTTLLHHQNCQDLRRDSKQALKEQASTHQTALDDFRRQTEILSQHARGDFLVQTQKLQETIEKLDRSQQSWKNKATELQGIVRQMTSQQKRNKEANRLKNARKALEEKHHRDLKEHRRRYRNLQRELDGLHRWNERFSDLQEFKAANGHCNVPQKSPGGLGAWVLKCRHYYLTGKLSEDQIRRLELVGIQWSIHKTRGGATLEERMERLGTNRPAATTPTPAAAAAAAAAATQAKEGRTTQPSQISLPQPQQRSPPPSPAAAAAAAAGKNNTNKRYGQDDETDSGGSNNSSSSSSSSNFDDEGDRLGGAVSTLLGFDR
jgi:hypothetical protein